ncbi:MAG: hypothetical protein ACHQQQ_10840 [Bacteroidota bacterium]
MRPLLSSVFLIFLLSSCSTTYLPYSYHYPLRREAFLSRDSSFAGLIPEGWFYSSEDTLAPSAIAWIVKDDFSATLSVQELHLDQLTKTRVDKEGLELLANISLSSQDESHSVLNDEHKPRKFKMRGREFCGYELTGQNLSKRVVVFSVNGRYYECIAMPVKGAPQHEEISNMFTAQQAFLYSLTF